MKTTNTKKKGFTIIELVIVIAVIAILAAVLIPTFTNVINKSNESAAKQAMTNEWKNYSAAVAGEGEFINDLYGYIAIDSKKNDGTLDYFIAIEKGQLSKDVLTEQPADLGTEAAGYTYDDEEVKIFFTSTQPELNGGTGGTGGGSTPAPTPVTANASTAQMNRSGSSWSGYSYTVADSAKTTVNAKIGDTVEITLTNGVNQNKTYAISKEGNSATADMESTGEMSGNGTKKITISCSATGETVFTISESSGNTRYGAQITVNVSAN